MGKTYDVIIIGLGAMGSSTAYALSKRGISVLGLEQFSPLHRLGSSHGTSRLIRKAYFENPGYVPLLDLSYRIWDELGEKARTRLFHRTGLIIFGGPESSILRGIRQSAQKFQIPIENFRRKDATSRWPQFTLAEDDEGVYEADAGYLEVENSLSAFQSQAELGGADLHFEEKVQNWRAEGNGVRVITSCGEYSAKKLAITAGPWAKKVLHELAVPLTVQRVPYFWFTDSPEYQESQGFPCFAYDTSYGFFYGFSGLPDRGVKAAWHSPQGATDPDGERRPVGDSDEIPLRRFLSDHLPALARPARDSGLCLYTMTPDEHFIIDRHPKYSPVHLAVGFSGHGFKFASGVGEILAERLCEESDSVPNLDFLKLGRFNSSHA